MNVAVGSIWRDSMGYVQTALDQMGRLDGLLEARGDSTVFVWCENASVDATADALRDVKTLNFTLRSVRDDCPYFPSVDREARWRHLAWVCNHVLDDIPDSADVFVYVESDLVWDPADMVRLVDAVGRDPVVAAVNQRPDGSLYDRWGTRNLDSRPFDVNAAKEWREPFEVSSAAGCTAMRADIARAARFGAADCYVGWCREIRGLGYPILLDPSIRVTHP